jgi:hypothetical protein
LRCCLVEHKQQQLISSDLQQRQQQQTNPQDGDMAPIVTVHPVGDRQGGGVLLSHAHSRSNSEATTTAAAAATASGGEGGGSGGGVSKSAKHRASCVRRQRTGGCCADSRIRAFDGAYLRPALGRSATDGEIFYNIFMPGPLQLLLLLLLRRRQQEEENMPRGGAGADWRRWGSCGRSDHPDRVSPIADALPPSRPARSRGRPTQQVNGWNLKQERDPLSLPAGKTRPFIIVLLEDPS